MHHLVDVVDDENTLNLLHDVFSELTSPGEKDIVDELTPSQLKRLEDSIAQVKQGHLIPDSIMSERIKEWLTK